MSARAYKYCIGHRSTSFNAPKVIRPLATYTALITDDEIQGDTTSGAFTVTLPTIASVVASGRCYKTFYVNKAGTATEAVTIAPGTGDTVNATTGVATNASATPGSYYILEMDVINNDWKVIATGEAPA
jgi:hypothetical protein